MPKLSHECTARRPLPARAPLRTYDIALALALALFCPTSAFGDEIFAGVGNYGSGGDGATAVIRQAAQGVANRLIAQSPSFVLSLGDMLYGTYPTNTYREFQPLGPSGDPSFGVAVGDLYGQYIKGVGSSVMNFFPVIGDHDWHHETIQIDEATGKSICTDPDPLVCPALGYNTTVNISSDSAFYMNAQSVYTNAQAYLSGANTNPSNTQFGLTTVFDKVTIFGAPNTPINGDTYETYFSGLYGLPTSQTASTAPVRWYDTLQGNVHVFALSTDPNELFQGGLKSINIQNSGTSADNLANTPQGQWFTAALNASTATWNIVVTHQPIVSASTPQEGYYTSGVTPQGHLSTAYMQWFDNSKVDLVLSAHIHGFERLYNNGITYINNGAGGSWQQFHYFCEQPGATNTCDDTYQVDPNFGGSSGTTWSNSKMIALTQMQVGNTYGFQLFQTSDANNYLESRFWGSTDPGNANGNGANWVLLDDFFILKNGRISASQAQSATGLELKAPNGASNGFGIIDTSGATGPITLAALINGPGQLVIDGGGTLILTRPNVPTSAPSVYSSQSFSFMPASAANAYSGGTYVTGGSTLQIANDSLLGASSGALTLDAGMLKASGAFSSARAVVLGSGNGAINTNGNQVALSGQITGTGALTKIGANKLILSGISNYTGPTVVNQGGLAVNGAIISDVAVNSGGTLGGIGTVGNTQVNSGGILTPGNSIGTITVNGNLTFGPGSTYLVEVSPTAADRTNVTGTATLAGNVLATFAPGSYITRQYTILHADQGVSGAFAGLSANAPTNFNASLSYDPDDVFLNLTAALGKSVNGLNQNQVNVATAINGFFNNGGALPPNFLPLFGLTGTNLATALSQLSGEVATAAQYGAFQLGNQFFALMLDPLVYGRGPGVGIAPGGGAMRLAAEATQPPEFALAYAKILKEPPAPPAPLLWERRWNVWAGGYGGANRTEGDPVVVGSHDVTARTGGYGAGIDYRIWPGTTVGVALAGGFTNWGLASGLGGGSSDAFQAGLYGITRNGPAYLAGALAFAEHWMSTDRFAFAGDHLTARFNAQNYGGRLEGGWRFATFLGGVAPYAAVQAQAFHTPAYNELDGTLGGFGLNYNARNGSDTRSELGARFDQALPIATTAVLALNARAAWAHDWVTTPILNPLFQTLPGTFFAVTGATPVPNSALASAGAELRFLNGWAIAARFDGEFADRAQTYAGTGTIRYVW